MIFEFFILHEGLHDLHMLAEIRIIQEYIVNIFICKLILDTAKVNFDTKPFFCDS